MTMSFLNARLMSYNYLQILALLVFHIWMVRVDSLGR